MKRSHVELMRLLKALFESKSRMKSPGEFWGCTLCGLSIVAGDRYREVGNRKAHERCFATAYQSNRELEET